MEVSDRPGNGAAAKWTGWHHGDSAVSASEDSLDCITQNPASQVKNADARDESHFLSGSKDAVLSPRAMSHGGRERSKGLTLRVDDPQPIKTVVQTMPMPGRQPGEGGTVSATRGWLFMSVLLFPTCVMTFNRLHSSLFSLLWTGE